MTDESTPRLSPSGRFLTAATPDFPLSTGFYVDPATLTPSADQNGCILTPFSSVPQALANSNVGDGASLLLAPANFYGDFTVTKNIAIESVDVTRQPVPDLTSSPHTTCGNILVSTAAVGFSCLDTSNVTLNDGAGCNLSSCLVGGNLVNHLGDVSNGTALAINSAIAGSVLLNTLRLQSGAVAGTCNANSLTAIDSSFGAVVAISTVANCNGCEFDGNLNGDAAAALTLRNCTIAGSMTIGAGGSLSLTDCSVVGNVSTATATIVGCVLGGNLTTTGNLTIDRSSYQRIVRAGHTITCGGTLTFSDVPVLASQIGWNPATSANSNALTVLSAGKYAPGLYAIYSTLLLQAVGTAGTSITRTITIAGGPTVGSALSEAVSVTVGAPKFLPTSTGTGSNFDAHMSPKIVFLDGTHDVTVQYGSSGFTGTPSIDVYAAAALLAA